MDQFKHYTFRNGRKMPSLGLGTWQSKPGEVEAAVKVALKAGYRHVDTAQAYHNEGEIGTAVEECIKEGVLKREDLFLTTKIGTIHMAPEDVRPSVLDSLKKLKMDYIDLLLIHAPMSAENTHETPENYFPRGENGGVRCNDLDYLLTYKEMEKLVDDGLVRDLGLSNFSEGQIARVYNNAKHKPSNLQVECHGYFQQRPLVKFCEKLKISVAAYAPIGSPGSMSFLAPGQEDAILMKNTVIVKLAEKYKRTPAQILLRNLLQRNIIVLPKSVTEERIISNGQLYDFCLSDEDMCAIAKLDRCKRFFQFGTFMGLNVCYGLVHFPYHEELPPREDIP